jgi:hypothetical protein
MESNRAYASLLNGALQEEFGFTSKMASEYTKGVIESVGTATQFIPMSNGGFYIGVFRTDFSDAMSSRFSTYTSFSTRGSFIIEWLSWFLFNAGQSVVKNYSLVRGNFKPGASRSGRAIMTPSNTKNWSVPREAGTIDDNWITQSVDAASDEFVVIVEGYIRKNL